EGAAPVSGGPRPPGVGAASRAPVWGGGGGSQPRQPRPPYVGDAPFLFYPAQFWAHKNHVTLLEALALLRSDHGFDVHLVLAGSDQGNQPFVVERIAAVGLSGAVHVRGFVERPELV